MWHKIFRAPIGFKINFNRLEGFYDKARGVAVTTPYFELVLGSAMLKENVLILKYAALAIS